MPERAERIDPEQPESEQQAGLTFDIFWDRWGDVSGFRKKQLRELWNSAKAQSADLPYHNFSHTTETLEAAMDMVDLCEANDVEVNRKVLIGATLLHDSDFDMDPIQEDARGKTFSSKEARSADIFVNEADRYGYTAAEAVLGHKVIMSTKSGTKPETIEDKIMVRADLHNLGCDYDTFKQKTGLLRKESQQIKGEAFSERIFIADSIKMLVPYISNDLSLGEFDTADWGGYARQNVRRLATEFAASEGLSAVRYIQNLGNAAVTRLFERHTDESNDDETD